MPIDKLSRPVAEYVANFHLAAVAVSEKGRLRVTHDQRGCAAAWWCLETQARRLCDAARELDGFPETNPITFCVTPITDESLTLL